MTEQVLKVFLDKYVEFKRAEKAAKELGKEAEKLGKAVRQFLEGEGTTTVKLDTGETIYLQSQYWGGVDKTAYTTAEVAKALSKDADFSAIVEPSFNTNTLSSLVREMISGADLDTTTEEIIEEIKSRIPGLTITENFYTRVRGAKI